jgi:ferritin
LGSGFRKGRCPFERNAFPNYHTSLSNTTIAFENLKKINNKLDENNIISLAYLSTNQYISDEEREQFKTQLKEKSQKEYEMYKKLFDVLRTS